MPFCSPFPYSPFSLGASFILSSQNAFKAETSFPSVLFEAMKNGVQNERLQQSFWERAASIFFSHGISCGMHIQLSLWTRPIDLCVPGQTIAPPALHRLEDAFLHIAFSWIALDTLFSDSTFQYLKKKSVIVFVVPLICFFCSPLWDNNPPPCEAMPLQLRPRRHRRDRPGREGVYRGLAACAAFSFWRSPRCVPRNFNFARLAEAQQRPSHCYFRRHCAVSF